MQSRKDLRYPRLLLLMALVTGLGLSHSRRTQALEQLLQPDLPTLDSSNPVFSANDRFATQPLSYPVRINLIFKRNRKKMYAQKMHAIN